MNVVLIYVNRLVINQNEHHQSLHRFLQDEAAKIHVKAWLQPGKIVQIEVMAEASVAVTQAHLVVLKRWLVQVGFQVQEKKKRRVRVTARYSVLGVVLMGVICVLAWRLVMRADPRQVPRVSEMTVPQQADEKGATILTIWELWREIRNSQMLIEIIEISHQGGIVKGFVPHAERFELTNLVRQFEGVCPDWRWEVSVLAWGNEADEVCIEGRPKQEISTISRHLRRTTGKVRADQLDTRLSEHRQALSGSRHSLMGIKIHTEEDGVSYELAYK